MTVQPMGRELQASYANALGMSIGNLGFGGEQLESIWVLHAASRPMKVSAKVDAGHKLAYV